MGNQGICVTIHENWLLFLLLMLQLHTYSFWIDVEVKLRSYVCESCAIGMILINASYLLQNLLTFTSDMFSIFWNFSLRNYFFLYSSTVSVFTFNKFDTTYSINGDAFMVRRCMCLFITCFDHKLVLFFLYSYSKCLLLSTILFLVNFIYSFGSRVVNTTSLSCFNDGIAFIIDQFYELLPQSIRDWLVLFAHQLNVYE